MAKITTQEKSALWKTLTPEEVAAYSKLDTPGKREFWRTLQAKTPAAVAPAVSAAPVTQAPAPEVAADSVLEQTLRDWDQSSMPEPEPMEPGEPSMFDVPDDDGEDAALLQDMPVADLEAPEIDEPASIDRATLLAGLDPELARQLTEDDIAEILETERARAAAERKKKAMERAREHIRHVMAVEHGLLDSATLRTREQNERIRQKVRIRFQLPRGGAGDPGRGADGIRVNGRMFEVNQWHVVTLGEFESLAEMHYARWVQEVQFSTLDQTQRFGISTMNRLQGTTPAKAIFAEQPNRIEMQNVEDATVH